jgi:hypothetical protein
MLSSRYFQIYFNIPCKLLWGTRKYTTDRVFTGFTHRRSREAKKMQKREARCRDVGRYYFVVIEFIYESINFFTTNDVPYDDNNFGLHHVMQAAPKLGRWTRIVIGQSWCSVFINGFWSFRWSWSVRLMNFSSTEVAILGSIDTKVVQHALVEDPLRVAATKIM